MAWRMTASLAVAAAVLFDAGNMLCAEGRHTTIERQYRVRGTTAADVAAHMRARPFRGDYGPAIGNIRPRYTPVVRTSTRDGRCRIEHFRLDVTFTMTLPHAVQRQAFDRKTERVWRGLLRFVRQHELTHRKIYLSCAGRAERAVAKLAAPNCFQLNRDIRNLLRAQDKLCEARHLAFDRRELLRLTNHPFFKFARATRQKAQKRFAARYRTNANGRLLFFVGD